jgi:diguanylate cyclase (GGDEF)-like protein/PAS domain S-box-containing protein
MNDSTLARQAQLHACDVSRYGRDALDHNAGLAALLGAARDACQAADARLVFEDGATYHTLLASSGGTRSTASCAVLTQALDAGAGFACSTDILADPRFQARAAPPADAARACAVVPWRAAGAGAGTSAAARMGAPAGARLGVLAVVDTQPREWPVATAQLLESLAQAAAQAWAARREQLALRHQAELAAEQARILGHAVGGAPLDVVLQQLAQLAQAQLPGLMCGVMVLAEDGQRLLCGAARALPPQYRAWLDGLGVALGNGSCAGAAYRRELTIVEDIATDPLWRDVRELALENGLRACWSLPIVGADGGLLGTFASYYEDRRRPGAAEIALVQTLAQSAAWVIERERAAHRIDVQQEQLARAQALARLGTWSYDLGLATLGVSEITCAIMGLPSDTREISVYEYLAVVHPADRLRVWRECFNSLAEGRPLRLEYRMRRSDGTVCYVEGSSQPEFGPDGSLLRFVGVLQDLTERRTTGHMLQVCYRAMQASNNGVLLVDATVPDMPILEVNPAFEQLTGYSRAEVLGRNCRLLQREDRDQAGLHEIRAAIAQQRVGHATLRNYRKDGSVFWADVRIAPLRDESGQVSHFAGYLRDAGERVSYEQSLAHQAMHDPLTGLPNRHLLQDRLAQAVMRAAQDERQVGVVMIDLDRFKRINDSLGHLVGDELLKQIALRLGALARDADTVARFGGDEFVFVVPGSRGGGLSAELQLLTERIAATVGMPAAIQGNVLEASASIGVAVYPQDGASATDLIKNADAAMYQAKAQGRAQSHFFDAVLSANANNKFEIEAELNRALRDEEFVVHYQPEFDARSGQLRGFEALIRWQHPQRGLLGPDSFIPVAEESGLIEKIGEWVMVQACRQNRAWQLAGMVCVPVAVNVSRVQFRRSGFAERVKQVLAQTGLAAHFLCLEITETLVMEDAERLRSALDALRAQGVLVAIDDFGTGYSSLSLIKQLPIDILKIDRSFVRDLSTDPSDAAICRTIISMAQNLGLQVVAEGVESEAQMRFLQQHGCNILQGYALCRPGPAEAIETFVREAWRPEKVRLLGAAAQPTTAGS